MAESSTTSSGFSYKDALIQGGQVQATRTELPASTDHSDELSATTNSSVENTKPVIKSQAKVNCMILDAGPLITQTYSEIQKFANRFYTTPAVHAEIRDERSRQNLQLWGDNLIIRQPTAQHVKAVMDLAKKTGDYAVLSITDMQLLALCRQLDYEEHGGSDEHLRKVASGPGANMNLRVISNITTERINAGDLDTEQDKNEEEKLVDDDGWAVVPSKKKNSRKNKYNPRSVEKTEQKSETPENLPVAQDEFAKEEEAKPTTETEPTVGTEIVVEEEEEEGEEDSDDEGWITTENLEENLIKENGEVQDKAEEEVLKAAVSTGDFAMQNVALQMGLNLVNPTNGRHITQVKSFMLRCHACFKLCPFPRNGTVKQFCPSCGNNTLRRCTVSVSESGQIHVFLKRNMQWSHRGDRYSLPNPQSHKARRAKRNDMLAAQSSVLLTEDQKEYTRAVKHDLWKKRQNEKLLNEWIGPINGSESGSVDSVSSPFAISGYKRDAARHTGVRVGAGRYVNSVRRKK